MDKVFKRALVPAALLSIFMVASASAQQEPGGSRAVQEFNRLDTNRDGFLSRGELAPLQVAGTADVYSARAPRRPAGEFSAFDKNGDGYLNRDEAGPLLAANSDMSFAQIDLNGDGYISLDEARPMLRSVDVQYGLSFAQLDTDGDGFLARNEARALWRAQPVAQAPVTTYPVPSSAQARVAPPGSQTAATFQVMDLNRDGRISRSEAADYFGSVATIRDFGRFDVDKDGFLSQAEADLMLRDRVAYR